ncbi:ATP-dependent DNA helicase RecG [bacterium]|nr:ATP-dependent DNA helicase RecG [bacterium]
MLTAKTNIVKLHKIAKEHSKSLAKINIHTIGDLLWHFPHRYDDLTQVKTIADLIEGELSTIAVKIIKIKIARVWKRKLTITEITATDGQENIKAIWFNQRFVSKILKEGDEVYFNGKPTKKANIWQLSNPSYEKIKDNALHSARLVPIYHLSGRITQKQLRFLMSLALKAIPYTEDPLPAELLNQEKFPWLHEALQAIHFPKDADQLHEATVRLKFQELFYLQCKYQLAKKDYLDASSWPIKTQKRSLEDIILKLPFTLTNDQNDTLQEVLDDLSKKHPMNRLIEGDVGSGKTIVAVLAALNVINQTKKLQVALMAPTEILAQQHFANIKNLLPKKYQNKIGLFTKDQQYIADEKIDKKIFLEKMADGTVQFIIGTHSLIQDKIKFHQLGLAIIDEQHRFGVKQRQSLKQKNKNKVPHLLSLTATPIPRTLSLTLYGDLDISIIKEKPAGRKTIKTILVPEKKRADAYKFILDKIKNKQQVFVICPLIDDSDKMGYKSVTAEYKKLNADVFPDLEIGLLHGKLKTDEKKKLMNDFKKNKFPILVATSVIEVGVDIPAATIMIIESAERFGLSQLHQFRGRIGRNDLESFCLLFTTEDLQLNKERLQALAKTDDGFKLAELDLQLRGSGEIFGTKQTGLIKLKIAKLTDVALIKKAQDWAKKIVNKQKYLSDKQLQKLLSELQTEMHLE